MFICRWNDSMKSKDFSDGGNIKYLRTESNISDDHPPALP